MGLNGMIFGDISARLPYTSDATIYFGVGAGNGGGNDSPDWMNGNLSEVLVYNGSISDSDRMDIRRYLGDKYGVTSFTADMPVVTFVNPEIYAPKGSLVTFTVNTTNPISAINNVEFFVNGVSAGLGTPDGQGNYVKTVTSPATGRTFNIAAIATNNDTPTPRVGGAVRAVFNEPIYVSPAAVGLGDGSSWDNAATLATVLPYVNAAGGAAIFMSAGVHTLTANLPVFTQAPDLQIYGGF